MTDLASVPPDPALPQLQALLDSDLMAGILGHSLTPDARTPDVRVGFVRYRPARSVVVGYEVTLGEKVHEVFARAHGTVDLEAQARAPESAALVAKVEGRTPTRSPLSYEPELRAIVQWLPLDLAIPTMAETPQRLRDRIAAAGLELDEHDAPRVVKHKPMIRGVLRFDQHVAKVFSDQESFLTSVRALDASASLPFPTARCTAVVPELLLATQSLVSGRRPDDPADVAHQAGALLALLHVDPRDDVPRELPPDRLRRVAKQAQLLATIVPALGPRLHRLMSRLEAGAPTAELVLSHGGFHASQLLQSNGEVGVVDFDGMCLAPAALDMGSYIASTIEKTDDLPRAAGTLDDLVASYGSRPVGVSWYLAASLIGRARRPFARFWPGWPDAISERVAAAEAALEL